MRNAEEATLTQLDRLRGMRAWTASTALASVYSAVTAGVYNTGYALFLGASDAQIGLLSAAPAWGQLAQLISPLLIERLRRRKPLCLLTYCVGCGMWLPIAVIPLLIAGPARPWAMVVLVGLSGLGIATGSPASTSWLTDLVPEELRARFVSRQQMVGAGVGLAASLCAGWYMDAHAGRQQQFGFASLFITVVLFGLAGVVAWALAPEPGRRPGNGRGGLGLLALPWRHRNFRRLTLLVAGRAMAVMFAGPFFTVFALQYLGISYWQLAVFAALSTIAMIATNPPWAYLADKFGYKPVFQLSGLGLGLYPVIWLFTTRGNYLYLAPLANLWGGAMSAGLLLSQLGLLMELAPEESRSVYIGFYSAAVNVAVALGAMLGGVLADLFQHLPAWTVLGYPLTNLHYVFIVSAILRFSSMIGLPRLVEEEASVPAAEVLSRVGSGRTLGTVWNLVRMLRSSDPARKAHAVRALGSTRSRLAVEELIGLLDDSDREVRREAARALGEIGDEQAVQPLITRAGDAGAAIAEDAVEALGKIPTPQSLQYLIAMVKDPRPSARMVAALALGNHGGGEAAQALEELLTHEHDHTVFLAGSEALSRIGRGHALHRLRKLMLRSRSPLERRELAQNLGARLGKPQAFYRLMHAEPMQQSELVERLLRRSGRRLRSCLLRSSEVVALLETELQMAVLRFGQGSYERFIRRLHRVATRALEAAASNGPPPHAANGALGRPNWAVHDVLQTSEHLQWTFGLLSGLRHDSRRRAPQLEEALLAVFAFDLVVDELVGMVTGNGRGR